MILNSLEDDSSVAVFSGSFAMRVFLKRMSSVRMSGTNVSELYLLCSTDPWIIAVLCE